MDVGQAIAIAPDGRTVYAGGGDGLVVLARNRSTGTLRQLVGRDGCIAAGVRGCATTTGIGEVHAIAVSPDGRNVYATVAEAESANDVLLTLRRNRNTGALRPLHGRGGCIGAPGAVAGCAPARAAEFIDDLVVSRDGRHVYAIGVDLVAFRRDPRSGSLTQLGGRHGCIARTGGCQRVRGILNSQALAIAPDDRHVYVTAGGDRGRLVVLVRDRRTGALRQLAGRAGCLAAVRRAGCTHAAGLSADAIAVSPDGRNVYTGGHGLVTLLRRPTTGALTPVGRLAARFGGDSLAIPPDGRNVYATSGFVGTETTPTIGIIMALARSP